ncbi:MAG: FAD binding domain-containing protein [Dehalococcoidales bacterium]|nr:FAD binding domain-containing protein [Dehalococcoidales bacterium]
MKALKKFTHVDAKSIEEAVAALEAGNGEVIAGGTDIVGTRRFRILRNDPEVLINIKNISPSLDYIKEEGGMLKIGALTRLEDIAQNSVVKSNWAALAEAAHKTASPHLREMGTIGGNICQLNRCWYFRKENNIFDCLRKGGDMCYALAGDNRYHSIFGADSGCVAVNPSDTAPALVALNATIVTSKRQIPVEELWTFAVPGSTALEADEIVTEIQLPAFSGKSAFVKLAIRSSIDFPIVNCAAAINGSNVRICLNAVHNRPRRVEKAEEAIAGKEINEVNAGMAGEAALQGSLQLSAMNKWKIQAAKGMVKKAILACK